MYSKIFLFFYTILLFFRNFAVNYLKRYKHGKERKSNKGKVY